MKLSRREMLKALGITSVGLTLAACTPAPAAEAPAASSAAGGDAAPAAAGTELTIWFHWGGATGERAQELIDT